MSFITAGASSMNALYNTNSGGLFGIGGIAGNLLRKKKKEKTD